MVAPTGECISRELPQFWLRPLENVRGKTPGDEPVLVNVSIYLGSSGLTDAAQSLGSMHFLGASEEASMSANDLGWIPMDLVWDIGAVEHVADRVDIPGYTVTEREGSWRRQKLLAAAGNEVPMKGMPTLS